MTFSFFDGRYPAPWSLDESTGEITDVEGNLVACVAVNDEATCETARMMAAAPEIFEALQELVQQMDWSYLGKAECVYAAIARAKSALKRASTPYDDQPSRVEEARIDKPAFITIHATPDDLYEFDYYMDVAGSDYRIVRKNEDPV